MNAHDAAELEEALRAEMARLAPKPPPSLLDRTLAAVEATPQRRRLTPAWTAPSGGWRFATASIVIAGGVAVGIAIGSSVTAIFVDWPGSPPAPPSVAASDTPALTASPPTPTPPSEPPRPIAPETWERIDLPDPAPGVFSSGRPTDVVAFDGGFVAVGSLGASCVSDIHEPPPDCATALDVLPSTTSALVWLSDDGRTWELLPFQAALEGASMQHVATDGSRIVASGFLEDPNLRLPAIWVSDDGSSWELVEADGVLPEQIVSTTTGFVGVRPTDEGPQFLASDDGRSWLPTTAPGDLGAGETMGMALGIDGTTVVAVGVAYEYSNDGELLTITGASWLSRDGRTWERGAENEGHEGAWISSAAQTDAGWVAVGLDQTVEAEPADEMAAWTSPDGLSWTRVPTSSIERAFDGAATQVAWTGDRLVATGTVSSEGGSSVAAWLSTDGTSWSAVTGQPALDDGTPDRLVAMDGWTLAVGVRFAGPDHMLGVVWLASP